MENGEWEIEMNTIRMCNFPFFPEVGDNKTA